MHGGEQRQTKESANFKWCEIFVRSVPVCAFLSSMVGLGGGGGGMGREGGVLGVIFAGYVLLASQNP